jgi:glycosyltransferase involved in cell wall biosynthesis
MSRVVRRVLCCHPSAELYGSDRVFLESVRALAAGSEVVVTVPGDGPLVPLLAGTGATVLTCPVPVLRKAALRPAGLLRLLAETGRTLPAMWRLLRAHRPDLVYVSTVTVPLWQLLARLAGIRVAVHVHEAEDGVPGPVRFALALPLRLAHTVLVNSRATARTLGARRTSLLYNGVPGPPAPVRPVPGDGPRIVLIGRWSPRKGTDVAVAALAELEPGATLDLYGSVFPGYEWYETQLRQQIRDLGLAGRVRLRGFADDIWQAYAGADVAVVPSRQEPFGNTAVEALLAGVPVVVTAVQGLPETVADGAHGAIVPPEDPAALADAIRAAAGRDTSAARAWAESRFAPAAYHANLRHLLG